MSSNEELVFQKPEKRLKNTKFHLMDSSLGCIFFVLFQFVFELIYTLLPTSFKGNFIVAVLLSFLVEAVFAFAVLTTAKIRNVEFIKATKLDKKLDWKSTLLAFALAFICLFAFTGLTNTFVAFLEKLGYKQMVGNIVIPNFGIYLLYVFLMAICPALFEELLFRGLILSGLKDIGKHKAVMLSALIFMLMHGGPDQTVHQFILGIVLGYAFIYSGTLWVPVIMHFLNNFVALTSLYITSASGVIESVETVSYTWMQIGVSFVTSLIMAAAGGALVWLCVKGLKKIKEGKEQKTLALLDKENLTVEEIENLKKVEEVPQEKKQEKDGNTVTIILFVVAGAYLVINWILTLVAGLM